MALIGATLLLSAVLMSLGAGVLTPHPPNRGDLMNRLIPPAILSGEPTEFPLGTDHLGRDLLSRLLYGGRITLIIGVVGVVGSGLIGTTAGLVSGYYGGKVDQVLMWFADVQLAFPSLVLAIALVAVLGPGIENVIIVLFLSGWVLFARIVRAEVLSLREREFVQAARALGALDIRILFRTILPNVIGPLVVTASFTFGQMIIIESSLSFLGLGVQPPSPSWGGMLSESRNYMMLAWWMPVLPGVSLITVVLAANLLGEWLQYRFDPRMQTGGA